MPVEPNPFDTAHLISARSNQDDPIIQYIIIRKSLGMSAGKACAQTGHGIMMFMLRYHELLARPYTSEESIAKIKATKLWLSISFRKVVLVADDKEWEKIKDQIDCFFLVKDAGLTEVAMGSETCIVAWPMLKSNAPKIIQKLQIFK